MSAITAPTSTVSAVADPSAASEAADSHDAVPAVIPAIRGRTVFFAGSSFLVILIGLFTLGFIPDHRRKASLLAESAQAKAALPLVNVCQPTLQTGASESIAIDVLGYTLHVQSKR